MTLRELRKLVNNPQFNLMLDENVYVLINKESLPSEQKTLDDRMFTFKTFDRDHSMLGEVFYVFDVDYQRLCDK